MPSRSPDSPRPETVAALNRFSRATPERIEARALLQRDDTKFLLRRAELPSLLDALASNYEVVSATGDQQHEAYRTQYLDTPGLTCFHDHRRGRRPRWKVRVRQYEERHLAVLEVKTRWSQRRVVKSRLPLDETATPLTPAQMTFVETHARVGGAELVPGIVTRYQRATLVGRDVPERVTVDWGLELALGQQRVRLDELAIVEVKQARYSMSSPSMHALRARRLQPGPMSKYCTAVAMLVENVPKNGILPTLRAIEKLAS